MKLKFLGAAGTVTGSSYVLTSQSGQSILIDLGMFQGPQNIEAMNYLPYEYDCSQLVGALLTHAHLDHCGRIPILFKLGFTGQIWMTPATLDLIELTLFDSAKIAQLDQKTALYDKLLVEKTLYHSQTINYHKPLRLGDFQVTFYNAGHLLGAASFLITDTSSTTGIKRIVFSGDLGHIPEDLLQDREQIDSADVVVMESTYGDRLHSTEIPIDALQTEINFVENNNGVLLIPAFSLEKTQELLYLIKQLKNAGKVRHHTPIYMDGPMAQKATQIYLRHSDRLNQELQAQLRHSDPFDFPGLVVTRSHRHSQKIHKQDGTKVIIAGAGMMSGGRIIGHAARYLSDPKNRIFFVGYQGEETLGRSILEGNKDVVIEDRRVEVKATVSQTRTMSAHADQRQLLDWLAGIKNVQKVILTHGEESSRNTLAEKIKAELKLQDLFLPSYNQELSF